MTLSKRLLDLAASSIGLLVLVPVFLAVAILIVLDDGGSPFFLQPRVGRRGRIFRLVKFRSMRSHPVSPGSLLTVGRDPRVTRVGHWLRKTKIDELPQLWNVLVGEMTLVGPRPEVERYVARYTPEQMQVLEFTPGITDPASLQFGNESDLMAGAPDPEKMYLDQILPEKLRISLEYARKAGLLDDLGVIARTVIFQAHQAKDQGR